MKYYLLLIIAFLIVLSGCSNKENEVIAKVGNEELTLSQLKSFYGDEQWNSVSTVDKRKSVKEWMEMTAFAKYADELGISRKEPLKSRIELAEKKVKTNAVLALEINRIKISEDELFNYYKVHQGEYNTSFKEFKIQRILIPDQETLDIVKTNLKNGLDFTQAVKDHSTENNASKGGYFGWVSKKDKNRSMYDAVKDLKKYQYTSIPYKGKYCVLRYYQSRDSKESIRYEELKDELRKKLMKEKRKNIYNILQREFRNRYDISLSF